MFKHLTSFYFMDWHHKHTYKSPKKREPPFLRPVNRLRHSPCPLSQVHLRPPAAPPVHVSHQQATPGHGRGNERGGSERESVLRINRQKEREHMGGEAKREREIQEEAPRGRAKREEGAPRACPSFMERGSALRSAPFRAPPPFWKLPKKGRSSLPSASHRASTNRGRAAPPRLCHPPRRTRREKSARLSELL